MSLEQVGALREQLFDAGFRPVPVLSGNGTDDDKRPLGREWTYQARLDPPACIRLGPVAHALNTGLLCDGLRAIDYDIDDKEIAAQCRAIGAELFGEAPMRFRRNSPRFLVLYRAAEGSPPKVVLAGKHGKIEALGRGQQFVAFGAHPSGAMLEWFPDAPGAERLDTLPAISEEQLFAFFERCAPIIGAEPPVLLNGHACTALAEGSALEIAASLAAAPNNGPTDWEHWNKVGMAVWRSCGGAAWGFELWNDWSARHPSYSADATRERWDHYPTSPPTQTGLGKLLRMAREAPKPEEPPAPGQPQTPKQSRIVTGDSFLSTFVAPDYVVDGIIQRGRIYACTSITGHGKTAVFLYIACMLSARRFVGHLRTRGGTVVYLAGENPDDFCGRLHAACETYGIRTDRLPHVLPRSLPVTADEAETLKAEIDGIGSDVVLIVADTAAAFFPGDDINDNVQMRAFASNFRLLNSCRGRPAVVILTHPVKAADRDNLVPAGGGAYLNELDGNLTLWSDAIGESTTLHWQRKLRGADFEPFPFLLRQATVEGLRDTWDRPFVTILAEPQSPESAANEARQALTNENAVLKAMANSPGISVSEIAVRAGWVSDEGTPHKGKVHRLLQSLKREKLVRHYRKTWQITETGRKEIGAKNDTE